MKLTQEIVRELLDYDPDNGQLFWKARKRAWFDNMNHQIAWNNRFAGKEAGCRFFSGDGKEYRQIEIFYKKYCAHTIIYLWMTGIFPKCEIDHIDHDGTNNKWSNLRDVPHYDNQKNKRLNKNNTSGVSGICWEKIRNKWKAAIKVRNKHVNLGRFDSLLDAVCARKAAEVEYGYHPNHGRDVA